MVASAAPEEAELSEVPAEKQAPQEALEPHIGTNDRRPRWRAYLKYWLRARRLKDRFLLRRWRQPFRKLTQNGRPLSDIDRYMLNSQDNPEHGFSQ